MRGRDLLQLVRDHQKYVNRAMYLAVAVMLLLWLGPLIAEKAPNTIVQRTFSGILLGGIYAIIALGIVVINKASGVFNFAHGGMMMVIGFVFFSFFTTQEISLPVAALLATLTMLMIVTTSSWRQLTQLPTLIAAAIGVAVLTFLMTYGEGDWRWVRAFVGGITGATFIGLVIERFTIRPLIGQPVFAAVMVTLAIGLILDGLTKLIWGSQPQSLVVFGEPHPFLPNTMVRLNQPIVLPTEGLLGGDVMIDQPRLYAFILAMIAFTVFFLFFRFTNVGLAMRATSENQSLAEAVGLRVRVILAFTWGIASLLAGLAGVLFVGASDGSTIDTNLQFVALRAFPAVLLGGLESIGGALIGGLLLGLTEEWAKMLFTGDVAEQLAPYILLMVVLVLRPEGLFGERRIERI